MTSRVEQARLVTKAAFKAMMDAATKAANLSNRMAEEETDPTKSQQWKLAAQAWQNSARAAYEEMVKL